MSDELKLWNRKVQAFGGRIGSPIKASTRQQLSAGQLGQRETLPTSQANPNFPASVLLAEMKLETAIAIDVSFSYDNMRKPDAVAVASLDQGDGFVRVTWGTPGAFQQSARIDGARGWRHPFVASFLRVEYVPIDPDGFRPLQGGQARDLGIGAMIAPASGAPGSILTKSVLLNDIPNDSQAVGIVPDWASRVYVSGGMNASDTEWQLNFFDALGGTVALYQSSGALAQWPPYVGAAKGFVVPQRAQTFFLATFGAGADNITNPSVIFELAL